MTVRIDRDVLAAVQRRAQREGRTSREVVSDLVRRALMGPGRASEGAPDPESFIGFRPFPHRGPAVSNEVIRRLEEEEH